MCSIGLTGGYCAGKNEVANILVRYGWNVIDVDKLGHAGALAGVGAAHKHFWRLYTKKDGGIDRKRLGEIVFQIKKVERIGIHGTSPHAVVARPRDRKGPRESGQKNLYQCRLTVSLSSGQVLQSSHRSTRSPVSENHASTSEGSCFDGGCPTKNRKSKIFVGHETTREHSNIYAVEHENICRPGSRYGFYIKEHCRR